MRIIRLDDQSPLTGWHMLALVCAFFGMVIAVNVVLAVAAIRHLPGAGRREQLRREPALRRSPRRGPRTGEGRLARTS